MATLVDGVTHLETDYNCYDALGRVMKSTQTTPGQSAAFVFSYQYNALGGMTQETYPSGRTVNTSFDGAGRPSGVSGLLAGVGTIYAAAVSGTAMYAPHGALAAIQLGQNLTQTTSYNPRLQPTQIQAQSPAGVLTIGYGYNASNNGNVASQTIASPLAGGGAWQVQQVYGYL